MSWERRGNGWYYYRRRKVGGKVVSEYIGAASGLIASARALIDADRRALRAAIRENRRGALEAERASFAEAEAEDRAWYDRIESATRLALEAAGYHQHAGGKWMNRRMGRANATSQGTPAGPAPPAPAVDLAEHAERALLSRFLPAD